MCLIGVSNLKESDPGEGYFWLKVVILSQREEKCEEN